MNKTSKISLSIALVLIIALISLLVYNYTLLQQKTEEVKEKQKGTSADSHCRECDDNLNHTYGTDVC